MMQAAAQRWRDRKHPGSIVNIVVVTTHGLYGIAHTIAARSGVIGLSRAVAVEWAPLNIRVNCVAPGAIETEGWKVYKPEATATYPRSNPMMRAGSPWDIAEACVYLAGPRQIRHRRNADGRRRRAVLGRDLDHGEAGVFWRGWAEGSGLRRQQVNERIDDGDSQRLEMPDIARQNCQSMMAHGGRDNNVGKSG